MKSKKLYWQRKTTRSAKVQTNIGYRDVSDISGITFLFKNNDLTDTFPIWVSRRIRRVSGIIFLFKNNDLTDTLPIRVSGRIRRVSVSSTYLTRYVTTFWVSGLQRLLPSFFYVWPNIKSKGKMEFSMLIYFLSVQLTKLTFLKYVCYILVERKINIFNSFICVSLGFETITSLKIYFSHYNRN